MTMNEARSKDGIALDDVQMDERRRALRAILTKPLLIADNPADATDFARVRRFAEDLREWLSRHAGWSLDITPEFARLRKTPADLRDDTRPAIDGRGEPFTRRRYVLLCLILAVLARSERQTTLGRLADELVALWNSDRTLAQSGMTFRIDSQDDRRDLIQVIRLLLAWQILDRVDGQEESFLHGHEDVLYNVRHILLARLLAVRRAPSLAAAGSFEERLAAIAEEPAVATDEQRNRRIRTDLVRRLLDDPVVYYDELSPEALAYFQKQRWHIVTIIREATGLVPEERAEGVALADPFGDCSDVGMPEEGTDGHATILVAEFLAARRAKDGGGPISVGAIEDFLATKATLHRRHWRKDAALPTGGKELARIAIFRLAQLGLVRIVESSVAPMAAIHRFRLREAKEEEVA